MEKYIKELSEVSQLIMEKVDKPIDVVQLLIEQDMLCCIHYLEDL